MLNVEKKLGFCILHIFLLQVVGQVVSLVDSYGERDSDDPE